MKAKLLTAVGLLLAGFLMGFIPQNSKARRFNGELAVAKQQLATCQFSGKLSGARELLAMSYLEANRKNFGIAQDYSSQFFDEVRKLSGEAPDANTGRSLQEVLNSRDSLTADLARGDPAAASLLESLVLKMHENGGNKGKTDAR
jgi:hypothetical protein